MAVTDTSMGMDTSIRIAALIILGGRINSGMEMGPARVRVLGMDMAAGWLCEKAGVEV